MWEEERLNADGLFWQFDVRDGMEESISGSRTKRNVRPTINSYMIANARAIAEIAGTAGQTETADEFRRKAEQLHARFRDAMWDEDARFFKVRFEDGGLSDAREAIGFVPWMFDIPTADWACDDAWKQITDSDGFDAPFGLTTAEQHHPEFPHARHRHLRMGRSRLAVCDIADAERTRPASALTSRSAPRPPTLFQCALQPTRAVISATACPTSVNTWMKPPANG